MSRLSDSVQGKKYSELTKHEWETLFVDSYNNIDTVCTHNKIINDSGAPSTALGGLYPPKFPVPVKVPTKPTK